MSIPRVAFSRAGRAERASVVCSSTVNLEAPTPVRRRPARVCWGVHPADPTPLRHLPYRPSAHRALTAVRVADLCRCVCVAELPTSASSGHSLRGPRPFLRVRAHIRVSPPRPVSLSRVMCACVGGQRRLCIRCRPRAPSNTAQNASHHDWQRCSMYTNVSLPVSSHIMYVCLLPNSPLHTLPICVRACACVRPRARGARRGRDTDCTRLPPCACVSPCGYPRCIYGVPPLPMEPKPIS